MKLISVITDEAENVPLVATFIRKEIRLLGWHFATFYIHKLMYEPNDTWTIHYWLYFGPPNFGLGIHIPVKWKKHSD